MSDEVKKNPVGRPSKYKAEYCQGIIDYMTNGGSEIIHEVNGVKTVVGKQFGHLSAYAHAIGVTHDTLLEWCKEHSEFSVAYKKAKEIQLKAMVEGGISGAYVPSVLIFALKNMHRWTDKNEISGPDGGPIKGELTTRGAQVSAWLDRLDPETRKKALDAAEDIDTDND